MASDKSSNLYNMVFLHMLSVGGSLLGMSIVFSQYLDAIHAWGLDPLWQDGMNNEVGYVNGYSSEPGSETNNQASPENVPQNYAGSDPQSQAYPNLDWQMGNDAGQSPAENSCQSLINVDETRLDRCGRLWVLDSGNSNPQSTNQKTACPPKLVAFDSNSYQEVKRVEFQKSVLKMDSLLTSFIIDEADAVGLHLKENCDEGRIFISDQGNPAVIVYDMLIGQMWRIPDPLYAQPEQGKTQQTGSDYTMNSGESYEGDPSSPGFGTQRQFFSYNPMDYSLLFRSFTPSAVTWNSKEEITPEIVYDVSPIGVSQRVSGYRYSLYDTRVLIAKKEEEEEESEDEDGAVSEESSEEGESSTYDSTSESSESGEDSGPEN